MIRRPPSSTRTDTLFPFTTLFRSRTAIKLAPDSASLRSNLLYTLQFHPTCTQQALFEEHRIYNQVHALPLRGEIQAHRNEKNPTRRLRIGYIDRKSTRLNSSQ